MLPLHSFTLNFGFSLRAAPSLCYERIIIRISNHTKTDKKPRWGRPEQEEAVLAAVGRVGGRVQCGLAEVWALFGNSIIF